MKKNLFLTFAIITLGLLPALINFGYGVKPTDMFDQLYSFAIETRRMVETGAPWWSWNTMLGSDFFGAYGYYTTANPFAWMVSLFPPSMTLWGMLVVFYVKTLCCAAFAHLYLRKMEFSSALATLGALLYTFSSYYVSNLTFYMFCEAVAVFPLLLLALERVVRGERHRYFWLAMAGALVCLVNFYFAVASLMLGFIYLLFRLKAVQGNRFGVVAAATGSVVMGCLVASVFILPTAVMIAGMPRASGGYALEEYFGFRPNHLKEFVFFVYKTLTQILIPSVDDGAFTNFLNLTDLTNSRDANMNIFGVLAALVYFCHRRDWKGWMFLTLVLIFFSPLNGMFGLFKNPVYGRWLYGLIMATVLCTLSLIRDGIRVRPRWFWLYVTVCSALCALGTVLAIRDGFQFRFLTICRLTLLGINLVMLGVWVYTNCRVKALLAMATVSGALLLGGFVTETFRHVAPSQPGYDYMTKFLADNKMPQQTEFRFRTDYHSLYRNLSLLLNRPGVSGFYTTHHPETNSLRLTVDYHNSLSFFSLVRNRESAAALFSVKEVFDTRDAMYHGYFNGSKEGKYYSGLTLKESQPDYDIYEYDRYIPMGMAYDTYVPLDSVEALLPRAKELDLPKVMLGSLAVKEEDIPELSRYLRRGVIDPYASLDSIADARRAHTATEFLGTSRGLTAKTDFDRDRVVFFSMPAAKGFTAYVDDKETKIYTVNMGMSAIVVPAGQHDIRFDYFPYWMKVGAVVSLLAIIGMIILYWREDMRLRRL